MENKVVYTTSRPSKDDITKTFGYLLYAKLIARGWTNYEGIELKYFNGIWWGWAEDMNCWMISEHPSGLLGVGFFNGNKYRIDQAIGLFNKQMKEHEAIQTGSVPPVGMYTGGIYYKEPCD